MTSRDVRRWLAKMGRTKKRMRWGETMMQGAKEMECGTAAAEGKKADGRQGMRM
jgi:hypothetical protein